MSLELQEAWQDLQIELEVKQPIHIDKEDIMRTISIQSKNPLEGLRKGLNIKRNWCLFFSIMTVIFLGMSFDYPQAMLILGLCLAYFGWGYIMITKQMDKLDTSLDAPIKDLLETYHKRVSNTLASEEGVGQFTLPLSVVVGYTLAGIYKGDTLLQIFSDPTSLLIMLGVTIVFGAGGMIAARKMNQHAFGKYLEQLKTNIDLLNSNNIS